MKRVINFIMAISLAAFATSCLDEIKGGADMEAAGASFIIENFKAETTKTAFQTSSMQFQWAENDTLGIFPSKGFQAIFPMESGAGSNIAVFDGGGWGLRADAAYYAYYPFSMDNFKAEGRREKVPYSYEGQTAVYPDSDGMVNLSGYDFMASGVSTLENGRVTFNFKHLGALCRVKFKAPVTAEYSHLALQANEALFPVSGHFNATAKSGDIRLVGGSDKADQFIVYFPENQGAFNADETIELYFLMPPVDLRGKGLKLVMVTDAGRKYSEELDGKNIEAGMTYGWETNLEEPVYDELINIVQTYPDGVKFHINVPDETIARGNRIRWTGASMAEYNVLKSQIGEWADLESIVFDGDPYNIGGKVVSNDSTIIWDNDNIILMDEYGTPVSDELGNQIEIHDPIVPGEPYILLAGEVELGDSNAVGEVMGAWPEWEGETWTLPFYDMSTNSWLGAFQKKEVIVSPPSLCEATVNIEIPEDEITVTDARIYFDMEEGVRRYFYMILDDPTYQHIIDVYFGGNEDWYQWYLTSYIAWWEWGISSDVESTMTHAAAYYADGTLIGGETYHVLCTVMGDEEGMTQNFIHKTFRAKEKTKPAPVIEVTTVDSGDPYSAGFNIKAPNKDVVGAYWAANYAREFELAFDRGETYETLLKGNYFLDSEELYRLNSDEGLTVYIPTLDGETMRFAIYGCNDEYTFNLIDDRKEGKGWADYKAPMAEGVSRIESPLYEALAGDWTATATMRINEMLEDGSTVERNVVHSSKITISNEITMPAGLSEADYALYSDYGFSRDDADDMYYELTTLTDRFNEYRLAGHNRMLCTGFLDFDYYTHGRMQYKSPYDLFTATDYSSYDVPQIVYDFGPKWFLEVRADGSVVVPFDSQKLPPMHAWPGYPFYVGGCGNENILIEMWEQNSAFPVEVSSDYNTITIKPLSIGGLNYYLNAIGVRDYEVEIIGQVVSDIVLTRGYTETAARIAPARVKAKASAAIKASGKMPQKRIYKSLTDFSKIKPKTQYKVDETPNIVTMDMVNATTEKILKQYGIR